MKERLNPELVENNWAHRFDELSRSIERFLRETKLLSPWRIDTRKDAQEILGDLVTNYQVITPANPRVSMSLAEHDRPFLEICKYYHDGTYARPDIFVCDVPDAYCQISTGMVCAKDFTAINDSQMAYRMVLGRPRVGNKFQRPFQWFKPLRVKRLKGNYTTVGNIYVKSWGHWIFDCLPRFYSLEKASAGKKVILLMPDDLGTSWHDGLDCLLPPNFELKLLPGNSWVQVDNMILASCPSTRANNHMPWEFYDHVRKACFTKYGLPLENKLTERIYISRAQTRYRRIVNEEALMNLLRPYGFKSYALENMTFRQQVELFHRAEVVITADGSNCGDMLFAGEIKILIFYADPQPNMHWFTAAKGLGQEHFYLPGSETSAHADFDVDLKEVQRVLTEKMKLRPIAKE